jgi:hypothetical protein
MGVGIGNAVAAVEDGLSAVFAVVVPQPARHNMRPRLSHISHRIAFMSFPLLVRRSLISRPPAARTVHCAVVNGSTVASVFSSATIIGYRRSDVKLLDYSACEQAGGGGNERYGQAGPYLRVRGSCHLEQMCYNSVAWLEEAPALKRPGIAPGESQ